MPATAIKSSIPDNFALYPENEKDIGTEIAVLYDKGRFKLLAAEIHPFTAHPGRSFIIMDLQDKEGSIYRFVAVHLPGGPKAKAARIELTQHLLRNFDIQIPTLLMGDMNGSPCAIRNQFERTATLLHMDMPFKPIGVPYSTHVNTALEASCLDLIYLANGEGNAFFANAFSQEVEKIAELLKSLRP